LRAHADPRAGDRAAAHRRVDPGAVDRPVVALRHVVLAAPRQLDRPVDPPRDLGRLRARVADRAAPEPAAAQRDVDLDVVHGDAEHVGDERLRDRRALRRRPDLGAAAGDPRGRVVGLERRVREVRRLVDPADPVLGAAERSVDVAVLHDRGPRCIVGAQRGGQARGVEAVQRAVAPRDLDVARGRVRLPQLLGDHRDAPVERDHVDHARAAPGAIGGHGGRPGAEHRREHRARVAHPRHHDVDAVHRGAVDLAAHVDPAIELADQRALGHRDEPRPLGDLEPRRAPGELAVRQPGVAVPDVAEGCAARRRRHPPRPGRRGDQHLARRRRRHAQRDVGLEDARRAAGDLEIAAGPHRRVRPGVVDIDVVDRHAQLLGDQRRVAGRDALADLGLVDDQRDPPRGEHRDVQAGDQIAGPVRALDSQRLATAAARREREPAAGGDEAVQEPPPGPLGHGAGLRASSSAARCTALRIRG
jgi:hypothetical protein